MTPSDTSNGRSNSSRPFPSITSTLASARFAAEAFSRAPALAEDLRSHERYNAACAAALAGCGLGEDAAALGEPERTGWRKQARAWLQADLAAWAKVLDGGNAADRLR